VTIHRRRPRRDPVKALLLYALYGVLVFVFLTVSAAYSSGVLGR
jgi:hypothetical protein